MWSTSSRPGPNAGMVEMVYYSASAWVGPDPWEILQGWAHIMAGTGILAA